MKEFSHKNGYKKTYIKNLEKIAIPHACLLQHRYTVYKELWEKAVEQSKRAREKVLKGNFGPSTESVIHHT